MRLLLAILLLANSVRAESFWSRIANFFAPNAPLTITTTALPIGQTGTAYSTTLTASGGKTPYRWSIQPLATLQAANLTLSGATLSGASSVVVNGTALNIYVLDKTGRQAFVSLPLAICAPFLVANASPLPQGSLGQPYKVQFITSGGFKAPGLTWSVSGTLPTGLTLDSATGILSGVPTTAGSFSITATASDGAASNPPSCNP